MVGFFTTYRKLYGFHPSIFLNHQPLSVHKHSKYLGFVLGPEILSNKYIDHVVLRSRMSLNILKCILGRDCGANASALRNTYISLVRPILEYGYPIYCCASNSNLHKL
ncbi:putative RNA-directed DNA polymerase from transposon BS [Nephila pilipes]|uniref:Putative RNA-directed DNA polymerase from transposon BS n=1 Tax=Nephila pilipes TaxID=299642 RepID=A0A8X6TIT6_NEPPI|nr:putative RNA-directed DNA polymerase from transposon BS [Nephila pilipes]